MSDTQQPSSNRHLTFSLGHEMFALDIASVLGSAEVFMLDEVSRTVNARETMQETVQA